MRTAVLFSGGKDSCLALHKSIEKGDDVRYLLNLNPVNKDSFMFHKPYNLLLREQARMLGIKLIQRETRGEKEKELEDLRAIIKDVKEDIEGVVVGGIASNYQGERIKEICSDFGLKFIAPLWNYPPKEIWDELLEKEFIVILTKVSCDGLDKEWVGKEINKQEVDNLKKLADKYKFRIDFEGGEAESFVVYMPEFGFIDNKIKIDFNVESEGEYRHIMSDVSVIN